ncbi:MAG: amidohydrolase family protein [Bryobacteraceae bacterium]
MTPSNKPTAPGASRREFLAGIAAATGGLTLAGGSLLAQNQKARRIDVHHHFVPDAYFAYQQRHDMARVNAWSLSKDLDDMDRFGTETAMLSITQPAFNRGEREEVRKVARECNDAAAKLVSDKPTRFGNFAGLPFLDIDGSLKEIEYSFDKLKADGVCLISSYGDIWLGNSMFAPIYDELNRRKAVVYVHPTAPNCCGNLPILKDGVPNEGAMIEYGTDTTRTIASVIFSGTGKRYPNITWIFSHAGGTMPFLIERFFQYGTSAEVVPGITTKGQGVGISGTQMPGVEVLAQIRRYYYDTAQASNPVAMDALKKVVRTSQIVYGTDYWYRTAEETSRGLMTAKVFNAQEMQAVDRGNAQRILPRLKGK